MTQTPRTARTAWKQKRYRLVKTAEERRLPCPICGGPIDYTDRTRGPAAPEVDHILPVALGGDDNPDNLRVVHHSCNLRRGTNSNQQQGTKTQLTANSTKGKFNVELIDYRFDGQHWLSTFADGSTHRNLIDWEGMTNPPYVTGTHYQVPVTIPPVEI